MRGNVGATGELIGLDWGTSSLRAYRIDVAGHLEETRERPWGIRQLPSGGFAAALADITAGWPQATVLACGMVGSRDGWHETPYVELPADAAQLGRALGAVRLPDGRSLRIVPGLHQSHGPDVMRGEETQLIGALMERPELAERSTWILPGTHSKWVSVRDRAIVDFHTWMTGELFAVLDQHSILGTARDAATADEEAFVRGVRRAQDSGAAGGLGELFSARSLMLEGELAAISVADYLSGLLLGEEFRSALATRRFGTDAAIQSIGAPALCARYRRAGALFGLEVVEPVVAAAARGLWYVARQADLLRVGAEVSTC